MNDTPDSSVYSICRLNRMITELTDSNIQIRKEIEDLESNFRSMCDTLEYYNSNVYRITQGLVELKEKISQAEKICPYLKTKDL